MRNIAPDNCGICRIGIQSSDWRFQVGSSSYKYGQMFKLLVLSWWSCADVKVWRLVALAYIISQLETRTSVLITHDPLPRLPGREIKLTTTSSLTWSNGRYAQWDTGEARISVSKALWIKRPNKHIKRAFHSTCSLECDELTTGLSTWAQSRIPQKRSGLALFGHRRFYEANQLDHLAVRLSRLPPCAFPNARPNTKIGRLSLYKPHRPVLLSLQVSNCSIFESQRCPLVYYISLSGDWADRHLPKRITREVKLSMSFSAQPLKYK
jgi:hypothetical protein